MSAAVIPFAGANHDPVFERTTEQQRRETRALRDARLIRDAGQEESNWQGAAILALVKVLEKHQRAALVGILDVRALMTGDREAEQAAAIIRFATGEPEHCGRVADILSRMKGGAR